MDGQGRLRRTYGSQTRRWLAVSYLAELREAVHLGLDDMLQCSFHIRVLHAVVAADGIQHSSLSLAHDDGLPSAGVQLQPRWEGGLDNSMC